MTTTNVTQIWVSVNWRMHSMVSWMADHHWIIIDQVHDTLPICSKSSDAIKDKILSDTTSPIDAASGVAKLSGFILNLCESKITATSTKSVGWKKIACDIIHIRTTHRPSDRLSFYLPKIKQDDVAVNMLDAISNIEWSHWKVRFIAAPTLIANMATMNEATVACTCTKAMLPVTMSRMARFDDMLPRLAWVDIRDARHMSKFPLRPNSAGTRMNNSLTCENTFQCYTIELNRNTQNKLVNKIIDQNFAYSGL